MTNQQGAPEALRLAASLELCWGDSRLDEAAAELRRLYAENERLAALVEAQQPAPSAAAVTRDQIREVFMAHGFTVKEGQTDLKQYVYDAADALLRAARPPADSVTAPQQEVQEPYWEGAEEWEKLAWHLCAEENGEDACNELIWEGGPIPEPWGERWLKYEGEARRMIALVRNHVPAPQPAPLSDDAKDAARYRWLSEHIGVAWDEGKFTSLVRIVSDKNRAALNASIDRMMAGDWSDAALAAQGGKT